MDSQFADEPILSGILLKRDTVSHRTGLKETESFQIPNNKTFPVETHLLDPFLMRNDSKAYSTRNGNHSSTTQKSPIRIHYFVITSQVGRRFYVYTLNLHDSTLALISTHKFHQTFQKLLLSIAESGMQRISRSFTAFLWAEFSQQDNATLTQHRTRKRSATTWKSISPSSPNGTASSAQRDKILWVDLRKYEHIECNMTERIRCNLSERHEHPPNSRNPIEVSLQPYIQLHLSTVHLLQTVPFLFCDIQSPKSYNLCEADMRLLISSLSPAHVVAVVEYILAENQIIFCSKFMRRLSECMESLLALIYPFEWPYVYIPLLPSNLYGFLSAPCPYLIGVQQDCESFMQVVENNVLSECIIVDLDSNFIYNDCAGGNNSAASTLSTVSSSSTSQSTAFSNGCTVTTPTNTSTNNGNSPHKSHRQANSFLHFLWKRSIEDITEPLTEPPAVFGFPHHIRHRLINDLQRFYIPALTEALYSYKPAVIEPSTKSGLEVVDEYARKNTWDSSDDEDDPFEQEIAVSLPQDAFYSSTNLFRRDSVADGGTILQVSQAFLHNLLEYRTPPESIHGDSHDDTISDDEDCYMPFVFDSPPRGIHELRKTFLKVFLTLFKSYRLYLQPSPDPSDLQFDTERFIRENVIKESHSTHLFYSTFVKTQIFNFFIQTRFTLPEHPDIFDEKSLGKMERFAINLSLLAERTHSGYIWKLGQVRHSWKYRYFVLRGNSLTYYKDSNIHPKRVRGTLELIPGQTFLYIPKVSEKHKTLYPFVLRTKDRTLLCCVETRQSHNEWNRILAAKLMNTQQRETIEKSYTKQNLLSMGSGAHFNMNMESEFMLRQEPWLKFMTTMQQQDTPYGSNGG